ncbi:hypothetical protein HDU87_008354 [Geranomyces variabilis]|uniref:Uncharacterized protein n=1 Tax=Geranomyces variabilis TaxID=109894 RepID=A0AAD5TEI4_9FUNG|nr:hypothetical protein HDU87_008354 [Geranomyces variabilis]
MKGGPLPQLGKAGFLDSALRETRNDHLSTLSSAEHYPSIDSYLKLASNPTWTNFVEALKARIDALNKWSIKTDNRLMKRNTEIERLTVLKRRVKDAADLAARERKQTFAFLASRADEAPILASLVNGKRKRTQQEEGDEERDDVEDDDEERDDVEDDDEEEEVEKGEGGVVEEVSDGHDSEEMQDAELLANAAVEVGLFPSTPGTERLVAHIAEIQRSKEAAPLFWGVLDAADKESCALLDPAVKGKARSITDAALTEDVIKPSHLASVFFSFDGWADLPLSEIADILAFGGLQALWPKIGGNRDQARAASKDADVRYLVKCLSAMAVYVAKYTSQGLGERAFDAHAVLTFEELPIWIPNSITARKCPSRTKRRKWSVQAGSESAKSLTISTASAVVNTDAERTRALRLRPMSSMPPKTTSTSPKPAARRQRRLLSSVKFCPGQVDRIVVPSLQILDNGVRFYILAQFAPELFIMREISSGAFPFPRKDEHTRQVVDLCEFFLIMRNIMRNTAETIRRAPRKRNIRRFSEVPAPNAMAGILTPVKPKAEKRGKPTAKKAKKSKGRKA